MGKYTSQGEQNKPRSKSPAPQNGRKSPFRLASRKREFANPSVDLSLPQDCAFPAFPTSRSVTPTMPQESRRPSGDSYHGGSKTAHIVPARTRGNLGDDVIKKMDGIMPGPFDSDVHPRSSELSNHVKNGNAGRQVGMVGSQTRIQMEDNPEKPSTSSKAMNHNTGSASILQTSNTRYTQDGQPLDRRNDFHPSMAHAEDKMLRSGSSLSQTRPIEGFNRQLFRSQTFAVDNRSRHADAQARHTRQQSSSTPAVSHVRKPSVAAANRPLDEIGSMSSYKPFRFATTVSDPASTSAAEKMNNIVERKDPRAVGAPPVPPPIQTMGFNQANFTHSPTESRSSNASSTSSAHTARSSRSSPPLSEVGFSSRRKGSDTSRIDNLMVDLQATIAQDTSFRSRAPPQASVRTNPPPSFSRPLYPRSPEKTAKPPALDLSPESPLDPSMQFGLLSPLPLSPRRTPSPSKMLEGDTASQKPLFPDSSVLPLPTIAQQPPTSTSPVRRPTTANKGNCRGCGELIKGKSVSSADGRLTGRYHKDCFVCKTCKEPFKTADFYIMDNNPYCSRHYHQLNGSLCKSCDRGIEGQYLEAETKAKFHPACFTCRVSFGPDFAVRTLSTDPCFRIAVRYLRMSTLSSMVRSCVRSMLVVRRKRVCC